MKQYWSFLSILPILTSIYVYYTIQAPLVPKYESDIVSIVPQFFLNKDIANCTLNSTSSWTLESIVPWMNRTIELQQNQEYIILLNGKNEGIRTTLHYPCLYSQLNQIAIALKMNQNWLKSGIRVYSFYGLPLKSVTEIISTNMPFLYLLMEDQLWVYPGITIGYQYQLEHNIQLTTVSLKPLVYDVEYFFTQQEADKIRELGESKLQRSKARARKDSKDKGYIVSDVRTSYTAFLGDGEFSRSLKRRATSFLRLPSPSFSENPQLVRYEASQFYKKHLDTMGTQKYERHSSINYSGKTYKSWIAFLTQEYQSLSEAEAASLPIEYQPGQRLHINNEQFLHNIASDFYEQVRDTSFFNVYGLFKYKNPENYSMTSEQVIDDMVKTLTNETQGNLFFAGVVHHWEEGIHSDRFRYVFPLHSNSQSVYFKWIRFAKEKISNARIPLPKQILPHGKYYPKFSTKFQTVVLACVLDQYSEALLRRNLNADWYNWTITNRARKDVLVKVIAAFPTFVELAIRAWEKEVLQTSEQQNYMKFPTVQYNEPIKHIYPQRFATLFLYLNHVKQGGETVFPYASISNTEGAEENKIMTECTQGLAVPARGLHASLFYVQTPELETDRWSRHGGCPPGENEIKYGSNLFIWNSDAEEGAQAHK